MSFRTWCAHKLGQQRRGPLTNVRGCERWPQTATPSVRRREIIWGHSGLTSASHSSYSPRQACPQIFSHLLSAGTTLLGFLLLCIPLCLQAAERWKIQFSYDKYQSVLDLHDLQCPSEARCIAAGVISEKNARSRNTLLLSVDQGRNWSFVDIRERPISLFFLNDSQGWMVTDRGVWATDEGGRSWRKLEGLKKGIVRVHFLDPSRGFAIGFPKAVLATADGGKTWTKVAAAETPDTNAEQTVYDCIAFLGQHGVITGRVAGPQDEREPIWLNPEEAQFRRQRRTKVAILETQDGGATWKDWTSSAYGDIARARLAPDGWVALFEYREYYTVPSSVVKLSFGSKNLKTFFREPDRAVTDFALLPNGEAILAAVEPPGTSNQVPIPGKLKMLRSRNLKVWVEMDVDYRAVAQRVTLASPDAKHIWAATDTGMILNLVDTENTSH